MLLEDGELTKNKVGVGANLDWEVRLVGEPLEQYQKYIRDKEKK